MEGSSDQENHFHITSQNYGGNGVYDYAIAQNQVPDMSDGLTKSLSLSQWLQSSPSHFSYVKLLNEVDSTTHAPSPKVWDSITFPAANVEGFRGAHKEFLYSNIDHELASGSTPDDSSSYMNPWELKSSSSSCSNDNLETLMALTKQHTEGRSLDKFGYTPSEIYPQNQTFGTQELGKENCNFHYSNVAQSGSLSKPRENVPRQRNCTDRERRLRINEKIKALEGLLPNAAEGDQVAVLNDTIEHRKFLELQIKELSRSRLGEDLSSYQFIFLEGCGHYLLHEKSGKEPLEKMVDKLVEMNPSAVTQLLESKGLYLLPMALAQAFSRAI